MSLFTWFAEAYNRWKSRKRTIGYLSGECPLLNLDSTTRAAFNAATTANAKALVVLNALVDPVTVEVVDGLGVVKGTGTLVTPWATANGKTLTISNVTTFTITANGTPDSGWRVRFKSGTRYVEGTFGTQGQTADFIWSRATWETNQNLQISNAFASVIVLTAERDVVDNWNVQNSVSQPYFTVAPTVANIPYTGGTIQFTAVDPLSQPLTYSLLSRYNAAITISSSTGLVTIPSSLQGTQGYIEVVASNGILSASTRCNVTVAVENLVPSTPQNLSVSGRTSSSISLSWFASTDTGGSGLYGYKVYRSTTENGTYAQVGTTVVAPTVTFTNSGLPQSTTYWYKVSAIDVVGNESAPSAAVSGITLAGTGGTATVVWTAPTTNSAGQSFDGSTLDRTLAGYRIYFGTNRTYVATGASAYVYPATSPYVFTGLASGTWYFRVVAVDGNGDVSITPDTNPADGLMDTLSKEIT